MDFRRAFFKSVRPLIGVTYKPLLKLYLSKPTTYKYNQIKVRISNGVFHPRFFFSTKLLVQFLGTVNLKGLHFFELGSGSGLISIFAAKQGAAVTACDISEEAVITTKGNAIGNNVEMQVFHSDMFSKIPFQAFDVIVVNPPYYKKDPIYETDYAMYCGRNLEYFTKFFNQVGKYVDEKTKIWMILSDDCDLKGIESIAGLNGYTISICYQKVKLWEVNYIFEIKPEQVYGK